MLMLVLVLDRSGSVLRMGPIGLMGLICSLNSRRFHSTLQHEHDCGPAPYPVRKNCDVEIPIET